MMFSRTAPPYKPYKDSHFKSSIKNMEYILTDIKCNSLYETDKIILLSEIIGLSTELRNFYTQRNTTK